MDQSGGLVSLPYDLTVPFARYVARQNITQLKRFNISQVYRQIMIGGQPLQIYECDFDIITPSLGNHVPDAEIIRIVTEILEEFPFLKSQSCEIRLSHYNLIDSLFDYAKIPIELRHHVASTLLQLHNRSSWLRIRHQLLTQVKLSPSMVNALYTMVPIFGEFETVMNKLKPFITKMPLISVAMEEIRLILNHLKIFDVRAKIILDPLFGHNLHYYNGIMFQIALTGPKTYDVMAVGGRYDKLISTFRHSSLMTQPIYGVGVTIAIEKIIRHVISYESETMSIKTLKPIDINVYICSFGKSLLIERMQIASMLWSAGIKVRKIDLFEIR
jgi:translation initiation factor 2-alpha kinase 4